MTKIIGEIKEEIIVNKINVAIVDDNERMLTLLENILNEDSDISVIGKGGDGLQALDLIHKKEPDVVLLDLIMPKLDGLEVMQKVNAEVNLKKKPDFIVISAIGQENITEDAFALGASYYIMKPFDNDMILNKIKQIALGRLGMKYPSDDQTVTYSTSGNSYVRQYQDIPDSK